MYIRVMQGRFDPSASYEVTAHAQASPAVAIPT